jgi:hypothetical protein
MSKLKIKIFSEDKPLAIETGQGICKCTLFVKTEADK